MEYPKHLQHLTPSNLDLEKYTSFSNASLSKWSQNVSARVLVNMDFSDGLIKEANKRVMRNIEFGDITTEQTTATNYAPIRTIESLGNYSSYMESLSEKQFEENQLAHPSVLVNLSEPDSVLLQAFKEWLSMKRVEKNIKPPPPLTSSRLKKAHQYRVLPYMDLMQWARQNNLTLTHGQAGSIIFPDDHSGSEEAKIRKHTRKHMGYLVEAFFRKAIFSVHADNIL